ncbi:MAG: ATP-dependent helicase [Lachnospiraceae bacterium]
MPEFNISQTKAIQTIHGPVLCLAGPGSGKTTSMVYRIKYMIEHAHIAPKKILVITFTRASARQMQERFFQITNGSVKGCTFGTFHSVFFSILKTAYGYTSNQILPEEEKYNIIRDIIRKMGLEYEDEDDLLASLISEIGLMKGDLIELSNFYSTCVGEEVYRDIYGAYEKQKKYLNKLDFDDMMTYCYELLKERQDILALLQNKYQYILVDEFQDINKIQYEITKLLAAPQNNLFIVGDDDQSIYSFRGARPEIMLHFNEEYPDAARILLDTNYRCSKNITEGSLKLIRNNQVRFTKELVSAMDYVEPICVHHVKTVKEENSHIYQQVMKYREKGIPFREMAVIMRTNVQARSVINTFMSYNIPFQVRDAVPCIYDHFAVKNILDYIRGAMGIRDRSIFLNILNKPKRYLKRDLLMEEQFDFEKMKERVKDKDWAVEKLEQLEYDLKILSGLKPFGAVNFIRKAIGYDSYLAEYCEYRHIQADDIYNTLDELQELAKQYKTFNEWFDGIDAYRNALQEQSKKNKKENQGITITTMHSAKGLEYDVVFIIEANELMTPYKKAKKSEEIEEERRMFYVAMTRAKRHLHIYDVQDYFNKELEPSRFLNEILINDI